MKRFTKTKKSADDSLEYYKCFSVIYAAPLIHKLLYHLSTKSLPH
jgi:hypothetical protein